MLTVQTVTKRFGEHIAVHRVSFEVRQGDAFGLLGPNGAGKSTTISMITGLITTDEGDISLQGHSIKQDPNYLKRRIGLVPQNIALYETLTARENLEFWGTIYGLSGSRLRDATQWCLKLAGLTDNARQPVKQYSGGMKRRLNIAVGLIHRPELLIMDEPTVGIDPQSRNHILETVQTLVRDGMTIIYTSHYMEEVQQLCKRLAVIDKGHVIAAGSLHDVLELAGSSTTITLHATGDVHTVASELRQDLSLEQVQSHESTLTLLAANASSAVSKAVLALSRHNLQPTGIHVQEPNLEAAFLKLTGRQLRDEGESA